MKKLLGIVLLLGLLGAGGYYVYMRFGGGGQMAACQKLAELCGAQVDGEKLAACQDAMMELEKATGPERARRAGRCILESTSCLHGMGCIGGAGLGAASEFMKGFRRAIEAE